jgi:hypothetical protein
MAGSAALSRRLGTCASPEEFYQLAGAYHLVARALRDCRAGCHPDHRQLAPDLAGLLTAPLPPPSHAAPAAPLLLRAQNFCLAASIRPPRLPVVYRHRSALIAANR